MSESAVNIRRITSVLLNLIYTQLSSLDLVDPILSPINFKKISSDSGYGSQHLYFFHWVLPARRWGSLILWMRIII